jgi:hypothetical protein
MKKTSIKHKRLKIKNNELIKEGWGDVAGDMMVDGSWTKIASTALKGAFEAFKRSWNTCIVLPWKIIIAFKDGKSLTDVMVRWEERDKSLKQAQLNIIKNTGVEGTVDAFIGVCNPSAVMFQKFCEWEDANMKSRWKVGASSIWNNTIAARNPDLKIDVNEDTRKYSAQIVYSNFVITVCNAIKIKIDQKKLNSYDDIKSSNVSFNQSIAESDAISKSNMKFRSFLKYLSRSLKSNSTIVDRSNNTYTSFIEKNSDLKNQIAIIESSLFDVAAAKGITSSKAADVILANRANKSLEQIGEYISSAAKAIYNDFKNFVDSGGSADKAPTPEPAPEPAPEPSPEPSPEPAPEPAPEAAASSSKSESVFENIKTKKLLITKNKMTINQAQAELNEASKRKAKKINKKFVDTLNKYYFTHIRVLLGVKYIIITRLSIMKYSNTYRIYNDILKNIKQENYTTSGVKPDDFIVEFKKLTSALKSINSYLDSVRNNNEHLTKDDELTKLLIEDYDKKGLDGSSVLADMQSRLEMEDKETFDNMINDFAKLILSEENSKSDEADAPAEVSEEQINAKKEEINNSLSGGLKSEINNVLVSASTVRSWDGFIKDGTVDRQINEISTAQGNVQTTIAAIEALLSSKAEKRFRKTLPAFFSESLDILQENFNIEPHLATLADIKDFDYESTIKNLEEIAEKIILENVSTTEDESEESDEESDEESKGAQHDVSSEYVSAIVVDDTTES